MRKLFVAAVLGIALVSSQSAWSRSVPPTKMKRGILAEGCQTLGVATLCFPKDMDDAALRVEGQPTEIVANGWTAPTSYEMEYRNGMYRVKVEMPSTATAPFFYHVEVTFHKVDSHYDATKFLFASSNECAGRPDLRRINVIDFVRSTITTILEPAWTADGKGRRYVYPIKLKTADIRKVSEDDLTQFLADTPANKRLCEDYG